MLIVGLCITILNKIDIKVGKNRQYNNMPENGNKYITIQMFCWIVGAIITISVVAYGYMYTINVGNMAKINENSMMIARLEERLDGILSTVTEIKDILKNR